MEIIQQLQSSDGYIQTELWPLSAPNKLAAGLVATSNCPNSVLQQACSTAPQAVVVGAAAQHVNSWNATFTKPSPVIYCNYLESYGVVSCVTDTISNVNDQKI